MSMHRPKGIMGITCRSRKDGSTSKRFYHRQSKVFLGTTLEEAILKMQDIKEDLVGLTRESLIAARSKKMKRIISDGSKAMGPVASPVPVVCEPGAPAPSSIATGDAGEALFCAEMLALGFVVLRPTTGCPYDVVVDDGRFFWRVQIKTRGCTNKKRQTVSFAASRTVGPPKTSGFREDKSYHALGVDIMAFVNWTHREITLRAASDFSADQRISLRPGDKQNAASLESRWLNVTQEILRCRFDPAKLAAD